jgi:hypothetical protein
MRQQRATEQSASGGRSASSQAESGTPPPPSPASLPGSVLACVVVQRRGRRPRAFPKRAPAELGGPRGSDRLLTRRRPPGAACAQQPRAQLLVPNRGAVCKRPGCGAAHGGRSGRRRRRQRTPREGLRRGGSRAGRCARRGGPVDGALALQQRQACASVIEDGGQLRAAGWQARGAVHVERERLQPREEALRCALLRRQLLLNLQQGKGRAPSARNAHALLLIFRPPSRGSPGSSRTGPDASTPQRPVHARRRASNAACGAPVSVPGRACCSSVRSPWWPRAAQRDLASSSSSQTAWSPSCLSSARGAGVAGRSAAPWASASSSCIRIWRCNVLHNSTPLGGGARWHALLRSAGPPACNAAVVGGQAHDWRWSRANLWEVVSTTRVLASGSGGPDAVRVALLLDDDGAVADVARAVRVLEGGQRLREAAVGH